MITIVINLVDDVHELDDIVIVDTSRSTHFEVKVDATSFISDSSFEESLFMFSNGLVVDIELDDLANHNLSNCARLELADVNRLGRESNLGSIVVVILLLLLVLVSLVSWSVLLLSAIAIVVSIVIVVNSSL